MPEYFDTAVLAASFDRRVPPGTDFLDMFFTNEFQSDAEKIVFDEVMDDEGIASYVSPTVATPDGEHIVSEAKDFLPSYIKERHTIKPQAGQKRMVGEQLLGVEGGAEARFMAAVENTLDMHQRRITRREILQANEAMQTGKVTIEGPNYPKRIVDYNRDAALSDALVGAARWGQPGVSILDYLESKSELMGEKGGSIARVLVLGSAAKGVFVKNTEIKDNLDNRRAADASLEMNVLATDKHNVMVYVGTIGDLEVYKYVQTYKFGGSRLQMFPSNGAMLVDPAEFMGFRCYGAIMDRKAGLKPLKRFPKVWDSEDPPATLAMTQSSPLMVPGNINASFFSTVV